MKAMTETPLEDRPMILRCLQAIEQAQSIGAGRRELWERCWSASGEFPPYFSDIVRRDGKFWYAPGAELEHLAALRWDLYARYFGGVDEIHEFGCGNGQNLRPLVSTTRCVGYDWSAAAAERVRAFGASGVVFDMLNPAEVEIPGAVLTVHALEQLGSAFGPLLDLWIAKRPAVCVHIEPIEELYDSEDLLDHLALAYHRKRGYLSGFLARLRELESAGVVKIEEQRRTLVCGPFHDAYSVVVWRVV